MLAVSKSINCELSADIFVSRFLGSTNKNQLHPTSHPTYPTPVMDPHMIHAKVAQFFVGPWLEDCLIFVSCSETQRGLNMIKGSLVEKLPIYERHRRVNE